MKAINFNVVSYALLAKGDTLTVCGKPHYNAAGEIDIKTGEEVQVLEVHPAGVTVKSKSKAKASFYFDAGAEKLKYTEATKKAIQAREGFEDDAKEAEEKETDLKPGGPTIAEFIKAGYDPKGYPPKGYAAVSTPEEIAKAIKEWKPKT